MYLSIGIPEWWAWLLVILAGALGYRWWTRRRPGRFRVLSGLTCLAVAAAALFVSAAALVRPVSVPVDSVGPRRVECGSVLIPVPENELTVTSPGAPDPAAGYRPVPRSSRERVCADRLGYRRDRAVVLTLVGALIGARGVGHLRPRTPPALGAAAIEQSRRWRPGIDR